MTRTYTYNPALITDQGKDQMRFELGDTEVDEAEMTCALCDEEYTAIITKYGSSWRKARLKCLEAICMKLSFEVTTSIAGLSYSLDARAERWQKMYAAEKKKAAAAMPILCPSVNGLGGPEDGGHYFYADMQHNHRKCAPTAPQRGLKDV